MVVLIILFIVLVLSLIILPFAKQLMIDKQELRERPIEDRFAVLIDEINKAFLDGKGKTVYPVKSDNRWLNLHSQDKANYLFQFNYSTGHLTVYLHYKYFHQELNADFPLYNVRNVDVFRQKQMAIDIIGKMKYAISKHQEKIGIPSQSDILPSNYNIDSDNADPVDLIRSVYSTFSMHQKKSIINMGYLIFSADGSSWSDYVMFAATRQQLNFLSLNWKDCQQQLENEGESVIYSDLIDVQNGVYEELLMFWIQLVYTNLGPNEARAQKFLDMNAILGHSEEDIVNRMEKIEAIAAHFGLR